MRPDDHDHNDHDFFPLDPRSRSSAAPRTDPGTAAWARAQPRDRVRASLIRLARPWARSNAFGGGQSAVARSRPALSFDLKQVVSPSRLTGLWRMMTGFRLTYLWATLSLGVAATSKTATYLLLRQFVDKVLGNARPITSCRWIALGFVGLALFEGGFTFLSGRLAARTAEGIARRLRNYLFDHIQRLPFSYHDQTQTGELIQRSTSDVDAMRRFFADQAIGVGPHRPALRRQLRRACCARTWRLALLSVIVVPLIVAAVATSSSGGSPRPTRRTRSRRRRSPPPCRRT